VDAYLLLGMQVELGLGLSLDFVRWSFLERAFDDGDKDDDDDDDEDVGDEREDDEDGCLDVFFVSRGRGCLEP